MVLSSLFFLDSFIMSSTHFALPLNQGFFSLASFDRRLARFDQNKEERKIIIVGASYAWLLGEPYGSYNLSITGARFNEIKQIMEEYCTGKDRILFFYSMVQGDAGHVRPELTSSLMRRHTLCKAKIDYILRPDHRIYINPVNKIFGSDLEQKLEEIQELRSIPLKRRELLDNLTDLLSYRFYKSKGVVYSRTGHLKELLEEWPNCHLIYLPILPRSDKRSGNEDFNTQLDLMHSEEALFLDNLRKQNIPFFDFSTILTEKDYFDIIHQNSLGKKKIIDTLHSEGFFNLEEKLIRSCNATFMKKCARREVRGE